MATAELSAFSFVLCSTYDELLIDLFQVVALQASTNNTSATVLRLFLEAVEEYGLPSRLRGDRGGENTQVSVYMIIARGLHRASFMWGT